MAPSARDRKEMSGITRGRQREARVGRKRYSILFSENARRMCILRELLQRKILSVSMDGIKQQMARPVQLLSSGL